VLDDLSFDINERDFVSIIGPSGCGKTTIFNIIVGLLDPDSGSMHYRGEEIESRTVAVQFRFDNKILQNALRGDCACRLTMYLATLDRATSIPSLSSSPWMRRAPQRIFDAHPPDQYAQLRFDPRSPSQWARPPTPVAAKAGPVPTHERLGPDDCENLQD
jgi:ABC-type cobalamin/Fe3+-siderophores transport system ATPase subunit